MKLKVKLPILLIALTCAPLLLLGSIAFIKLKNGAEQSGITQVTKFLEQMSTQIATLVHTAQANADLMANDPLLTDYILTEDEEERYALMQLPLLRKLKNIMQVFPQYQEMRVIHPDGYEDLRLTIPFLLNQSEYEKSSAYFTSMDQAKKNNHYRFMINPDNDKFSLYVSKRVNVMNKATGFSPSSKKNRGYLVITVDLELLEQALISSPWKGGHFVITDVEGQILLPHADKSLGKIAWRDIALEQPDTNTAVKIDHHDNTFLVREIAGNRYYHTSIELGKTLFIHALIPEHIFLKYSLNIRKLVIIVTFISILISIPLLFLLSHTQILRPLKQLNEAFLHLGNNKELTQVDVVGDDEINELSTEFNRMSHKLFKSNEKIRELAFNDSLTGLPNRFMFTKYLSRTLECAKNDNKQLAVMFIDLDNFKHINDSLGHQSGDLLLQEVALRLSGNMRNKDIISYLGDRDIVARLGGDEFTILLVDIPSVAVAEQIAKRIIEIISLPFTLSGKNYYVGCSIGIAYYPENGLTTQELIKNADIAMYHAKNRGKGGYHEFTDILSHKNNEYATIEQKMHEALENEAFELYFQPIVDGITQQIISLEALIRWNDAELGFIPPDKFIPLAEKNGLITGIGDWVIREGCRHLKIWQDNGITDVKLAINVSAIQLNNPQFAEELSNYIAKSGIIPGSLYIELTETAIIDSELQVLETLKRLRKNNIKIALDDFGTGYSSLSYLRNLPIDILKIDRAFICEINSKNNNVILSAVITMAHALGFKVVAEGIEEQEHLTFLVKEGCDMLQGYMFSRPKSASDITVILLNDLTDKTKTKPSIKELSLF